MKRTRRTCRERAWFILTIVALVLALAGRAGYSKDYPELSDPAALADAATQEAVTALVASMPADLPVTSVGLALLSDDRAGSVTNALAVAMSEAGRFELRQLSGLGVAPTQAQLSGAAEDAQVGAVLVGEVVARELTTGSARVAVAARLLATGDGEELWSGKGEGEKTSALGVALSLETVIEKTIDQQGLLNAAEEKVCRRLVDHFGSLLSDRVGVMPVVGDADGSIGKCLVSALSEEAEVVALDDGSPTLDSATAARLGQASNVPVVVVSQVERADVMFGRAEVTLHGRLVRASDGTILKAVTLRQVHQTHVGRYRWVVAGAVAVVVLLLVALTLPRVLRAARRAVPGQATAMRERELSADQRLRERIAREIRGCLDHLKNLADSAVSAGQTERQVALQELRRDLDVVRLEIENAPFGHHPELAKAGVDERGLRQIRDAEQRVLGMVEGLHRELRGIGEQGADVDLGKRLEALRRQVSDIAHRFRERQNLLAGLRG